MTKAVPMPAAGEAVAVVAICFGWFIYASVYAVAAGFPSGGSFNDASLIGVMVTELVFGALALALLRYRGHNLSTLLPSPDWRGCAEGVCLYLATIVVWYVVWQALPSHHYADQPVAKMLTHSHPTLAIIIAVSMVNGLYEETFLVGYLVKGFTTLGAPIALGISALVRLMYHLYQGPDGAVSALVFGLVLSFFYWHFRKLWPVVFAHTLADAVAFASLT